MLAPVPTAMDENFDRMIIRLDPGGPIDLAGLGASFAALARIYDRARARGLATAVSESNKMTSKADFLSELRAIIRRAREQKRPHVEVNAGELHRTVGGYPSTNHSMPTCCGAMREEMKSVGGEVVFETESGASASFTIKYTT